MNDSNMDLEKHVDVIRKYNDGNIYSAFIIENQSYVDMSMVVRAAAYEYVAYERMLKKSKKNKSKEKLPMVHILVFCTGERPWNAARQFSELVEVDERFESYFHDYKMNLIEITGNTSYNFNEEDVYNLFYICRSIYDQSIYEGTSNHFGLVKSSVLKVVKTLTDVEWLDLEELEEKEVTAAAGGGAVEVTVSGKHEVTKVKLAEEVVDPDDIEMLEDLIMAATNEAMRKIDEASQQSMSQITGALGGGLPF